MNSKHLNPTQMKGLIRLGDVVCPGDKELPRFSKTEFHLHSDRMFDYMEKEDLEGLKVLLFVFAFLPKFLINALLTLTEKSRGGNFLMSNMRLMNIGLKGIIFTLYYSKLDEKGQEVFDTLKWDSAIKEIPIEEDSMYPYTDQATFSVSKDDSPEAIMTRARIAQSEIRDGGVTARINILRQMKEVILDSRDWIIDQIQKENGKSRSDALISEIFGVLDHIDYLVKHGSKIIEDESVHTPIALLGKKSRIFYEPLGTILIISPWNYPFYQAIVPITSAFMAGNAVVYKPSEFTPLEGIVEKVLERSGFDPSWCQIVYGDGKVGSDLINQRPDKIFFTGSVATGKKIMSQASEQLIPVELELGGKDPSIVFEDASLERSVRGVIWGGLTCSGQSCTSVEQVFVQSSIFDAFKEKLLQEVKKIRIRVDDDGDSEIGLMTTDSQVSIVADHIEDALSKGAILLTGKDWDRKSKFIPPLVLENISKDMKIFNEETFGPILPLLSFDSESEVIESINSSSYGLSASLWSKDKERCDRVARALHTGNVSINNVMLTEGNPALPFGGVKNSGIGRYKGEHGLRGFCNLKSVLYDSNSDKCEVNWYPYTSKKYKLFDQMTEFLFRGGIKNFLRFALTGLKLESYSDKEAKRR